MNRAKQERQASPVCARVGGCACVCTHVHVCACGVCIVCVYMCARVCTWELARGTCVWTRASVSLVPPARLQADDP